MERLLGDARNGDEDAERQIYRILFARFRAFAKRIIRDSEEAGDIAQDACLTVLEKYKTETFTTSFEAWAYGVLRMKIGNYLQSAKVRTDRSAGGGKKAGANEPAVPPPDYEMRRRLLSCLRKLAKSHRRYARVLNLIHQGYGAAEISQRLQITASNVYVILSRGRSLLKACLETGSA